MTEQATSPTDAEQVILLRTANTQLRTRMGELEELKDSWRRVAERLEGELSELRTTISDLRTQRLRLERKNADYAAAIAQWEQEPNTDELQAQIEEARAILSALDSETLVEAARDLVRECETDNEAYHTIHARYWKEAVPQIGALESVIDQAISNLRGMKALNDNPHIEEMIDATADMLGARVSSTGATHEPAQKEETRGAIGREWLHVFDTLIEDTQQSLDNNVRVKIKPFVTGDPFFVGKMAALTYLRTLAEEDIQSAQKEET